MKNIKIKEGVLSDALVGLEKCLILDTESAHLKADSIIVDLLNKLDLKEIAEAYQDVPKWYG